MRVSRPTTLSLRGAALFYLTAVLLLLPVGLVFFRTFQHGFGVAWDWITTPAAISALSLTHLMAAIAVPLNTIFGVGCALVLVRSKTRGRWILDSLIDLPFVVSPIIVGLALILVYGLDGWFGRWFLNHGIRIIYSPIGMILATIFVSLPFVVREVAPVLMEVGTEQEEAAATLGASSWQTFWRITLPSIRWGVAYGVVLTTARALGEIGAVLVVSSLVAGSTLTLPLLVYERDQGYGSSAITSSYAAATELVVLSLVSALGHDRAGLAKEHRQMRIDVNGVGKQFGEFVALKNVSLLVDEGSLTDLLGPSGSGKTTLLRVIAGYEAPTPAPS